MLKEINVSGFKSLENFSLEFHRGLNVIVGPNGSGKTNILSFLEFLSHLCRNRLLDAVSRSGGAGRIFRKTSAGKLGGSISFTIRGDGYYRDYHAAGEAKQVKYEYSAEVHLREETGSLLYGSQTLKLAFDDNREWPVEVEALIDENETSKIYVSPKTENHFHDRYSPRKSKRDPELQTAIKEILKRNCQHTPLYQILERYLPGTSILVIDLQGAQSFNISPSAVRRLEDIASEPVIEEDGRGLAAVLFALTKTRQSEEDYWDDYRFQANYRFAQPDELFTKIIAYSRVVSDAIQDITVEPDAIENQLRIFVKVDYGDGSIKLPFSLVSDGTAKWFALVTAIITSTSVFAIEEPENFLHPLMQREIVRIVRDEFSTGATDVFAVMTTHSETILNSVDPEEMILVHMEDGRSIAKRPSNGADVREEINRTGFGAGYYYLAGAIE